MRTLNLFAHGWLFCIGLLMALAGGPAYASTPALVSAGPTVLIAHRANDGWHRESSLIGMQVLAREPGRYVELDTRWTADHVAVIWHDPALWVAPRCTGPGAGRLIEQLRSEEVEASRCDGLPVATLAQVVGVLSSSPSLRLWLEPKTGDVPTVLALTEPVRERVTVTSTVPAWLRTAASAGYEACYMGRALPDLIGGARANGWPCVAAMHTDPAMTRARVEAARTAGVEVVPWTVNSPTDLAKVCGAAVRYVVTDRPALGSC